MNIYIVINGFQDNNESRDIYRPGDIYPGEGLESTEERIKELSTKDNRMGYPFIKRATIREMQGIAYKKGLSYPEKATVAQMEEILTGKAVSANGSKGDTADNPKK